MAVVKVSYEGNCRNKIDDKGVQNIFTDISKEAGGNGEMLTPGDLLVAALMTCAMTNIEAKANKEGYDITGFCAEGDKVSENGKISEMKIDFYLPKSLNDEARANLERVSKKCFVGNNIDPSIEKKYNFIYR